MEPYQFDFHCSVSRGTRTLAHVISDLTEFRSRLGHTVKSMIYSVYSDIKSRALPTELWTLLRGGFRLGRTLLSFNQALSPYKLNLLNICAFVGIEPHITDFYSSTLSRAADFRLVNPDCTGRLQSPIYCDKLANSLLGWTRTTGLYDISVSI